MTACPDNSRRDAAPASDAVSDPLEPRRDPARPGPGAPGEVMSPLSALRRILRDGLCWADVRDLPVHADVTAAPTVPIRCARSDLSEGCADADGARPRAAGVSVTVQENGVLHAWQVFAARTPGADRAIDAIAKALE